jgi:predicted O-methyltransferase YrrM
MTVPESTFTLPRPDCPHPERLHAVDGAATEDEVTDLVAAMVAALAPDFAVETGSYVGRTSRRIGQVLQVAGVGRLVTLEVDPEAAEKAAQACAGLPVDVLLQSSLEYVPDRPIDFAWFDSEIALRAEEYRRYHPWMHVRTVVGFHDTAPHHALVSYLDELVAEGIMAPPLYLPTPRGVCFARPLP